MVITLGQQYITNDNLVLSIYSGYIMLLTNRVLTYVPTTTIHYSYTADGYYYNYTLILHVQYYRTSHACPLDTNNSGCRKREVHIIYWSMVTCQGSRLTTRDGTAEPVSRDQILRRQRGQGKIPSSSCSADHEQDWLPYLLIQHVMSMCVYVCVLSSHLFWTSGLVCGYASVTREKGHTGFLHLSSAVLALIFVARRIQPFLSLINRDSRMLCTNELIVPPFLGHFSLYFVFFCEEKSQFVRDFTEIRTLHRGDPSPP